MRSRPLTSRISLWWMMPVVASWTRPWVLLVSMTVTPPGPMARVVEVRAPAAGDPPVVDDDHVAAALEPRELPRGREFAAGA
jgi:hypothetical protein